MFWRDSKCVLIIKFNFKFIYKSVDDFINILIFILSLVSVLKMA